MVEARTGLGLALASQNRLKEAEAQFTEAVRLKPEDPRIQLYLGSALAAQGRQAEALEHYRAALHHAPDWPPLLENCAWLLATAPEARLRNGPLAVQLAERAAELTRRQSPVAMDALAAAYAETGQFPQAVAAAQEALAVVQDRGDASKVGAAQKRLALYQAGRPCRDQP
jgi:Flp pilus assembly protein TadD